jgi:hypothetical protein
MPINPSGKLKHQRAALVLVLAKSEVAALLLLGGGGGAGGGSGEGGSRLCGNAESPPLENKAPKPKDKGQQGGGGGTPALLPALREQPCVTSPPFVSQQDPGATSGAK